jgi:tetratricopeptide (TPR) repeat protein
LDNLVTWLILIVNGDRAMLQKQNNLMYLILVLMLLALLGFSSLPLFSSIMQTNQPSSLNNSAQNSTIAPEELGKLEAEAKGYQKVLEKEPNNQTALEGLLRVKFQQKDSQGVITTLEQLAQAYPQQTEYTILLAQAKQQVKDYEGAAAAYHTILDSRPGDVLALNGIVNLFLMQNQPTRAIALLEDTITQGQQKSSKAAESIDVASLQLLLGEVYATQNRYEDAIATYDAVMKNDAKDFRPVVGKALVLQMQGKQTEAKPLLEKAYSLAPSEFKDQISQLAKRTNTEKPVEQSKK